MAKTINATTPLKDQAPEVPPAPELIQNEKEKTEEKVEEKKRNKKKFWTMRKILYSERSISDLSILPPSTLEQTPGLQNLVIIAQRGKGWLTYKSDNDRIYTRSLREGSHLVLKGCLLYTSPSPRDATLSRMPSSA